MTCQTNGRSPTRAMGLGPVVTPSRIRIPSPPQKRTTFIVSPQSDNLEFRNGKDQTPTPRSDIVQLRRKFLAQVPRKDKHIVRLRLGQALGRENRNVGTGQVLPLLHGTAVNGVLEEVLPDTAVVEQRISLAGRAVSGHRPSFPRRAKKKTEEVALDLQ